MSYQLRDIDIIIFDFGNVLIDLDYPCVIRNFARVAKKNIKKIEKMVVTAPILQRFEMGMMSPDEFISGVNKLLGTKMSACQFTDIWNSMLKSITNERMNKVLEIGKQFDTYILSNTNIIHEIAYEKMIVKETGRSSLREFVKDVFYSHEMGLRKPNIDCYEYVIDKIDRHPSRILFLDDRLDNVEGAKRTKMKAIQIVDPDKQLNEIFNLG